MYTPVSQVLLTIPKAFQDELITDSGLKFFLDPSYKKELNVSVTAKIAALPINPHPKDKKILDQLKVGDSVGVSYQIVSDLQFGSDRNQFMSALEENPHVKEFYNAKGESVKVYALPARAGIQKAIWCGMYLTKQKELIDGVQGDEETVERWLSQFPFGKTDIYTFNNFFEYGGQDYWKCDLSQIFAKKVKGHLVAIGNRVICAPIDESVKDDRFIDTIGIKDRVKIRRQDRARVITGGKSKGLRKEDIVSFYPNHVEKYQFWGKDYYMVREDFILGRWN